MPSKSKQQNFDGGSLVFFLVDRNKLKSLSVLIMKMITFTNKIKSLCELNMTLLSLVAKALEFMPFSARKWRENFYREWKRNGK